MLMLLLLLNNSTYDTVDCILFNIGLNWFIIVLLLLLLLFFIVIGSVLYFLDEDDLREFFELTEPND